MPSDQKLIQQAAKAYRLDVPITAVTREGDATWLHLYGGGRLPWPKKGSETPALADLPIPKDPSRLTRAELRLIAAQLAVKGARSMNKDALIAALLAYQESHP